MDAKIDYQEGTVIMNHPPQSVYQQVIEKTKGAFFRTQVLRLVSIVMRGEAANHANNNANFSAAVAK